MVVDLNIFHRWNPIYQRWPPSPKRALRTILFRHRSFQVSKLKFNLISGHMTGAFSYKFARVDPSSWYTCPQKDFVLFNREPKTIIISQDIWDIVNNGSNLIAPRLIAGTRHEINIWCCNDSAGTNDKTMHWIICTRICLLMELWRSHFIRKRALGHQWKKRAKKRFALAFD